jgi:hypothetical protein
MFKLASMLLVCLVAGCASSPPPGHSYSVCSTQPGTHACQVEQYHRVGF